jgi:hypothetical protein
MEVVNKLQNDWITLYLYSSVCRYAYRYVIVICITNYTTAYLCVELARKEIEDYYYYYYYHHHHPSCHIYAGYLQLDT